MKNAHAAVIVAILTLNAASCDREPGRLFPITDARGKIGFIDASGKVVVAPRYDFAGTFVDGVALVREKGSFLYIDADGTQAIPNKYPYAGNFSNGLAAVGSGAFADGGDDRYGYPPYSFRGTFGYIDRDGDLVIPFKFGLAGEFSEGRAAVGVGSLYYEHKRVRACKPYTVTSRGFRGKFGYIDTTGNMVIPPVYEEARAFSNGLALVRRGGKYMYIDRNGVTVWSR